MNFFKMHIGDYESHTMHLSILEDGIYNRLLRRYYMTERPLPTDQKELARLVRARSRHEVDALARCVNYYFSEMSDGKLHNSRADKEIEQYQAQCATNRKIARARFVDENNQDRTPNQIPDTRTSSSTTTEGLQPTVSAAKKKPRPGKKISETPKPETQEGGWWRSDTGIEATAKTLGIKPLSTETYQQLKERCFSEIEKRKRNGGSSHEPETCQEPTCARCNGTLAAGWTMQSEGKLCNGCYYTQIGH